MAAGTPAVMTAYGELLARLSSGAFRPGSRLPGERALSVSLGVSRTTLRSSLDLLADEGWLVPSDRRGWYVRSSVVGEPPNTLQSFSEMAAAKGLTARTHILMHRTRTVEFDEANSLQVPLGSDVVELVRLRSLDDVAICHDRSVLPLALVPPLENADLEDRSLYDFLREECGIEIARSLYSVHADLMRDEFAQLLDVDPQSPALVADELTFDRGNTPVLRGTLTYRADAYRFQANLLRPAR